MQERKAVKACLVHSIILCLLDSRRLPKWVCPRASLHRCASNTVLATGLRIKLGSTQQPELSPQDMHQHFQVVRDGSLAEVQEPKAAHLLAAVAGFVQQTTVAPGSLRYTSEDSLAAVQQRQTVDMIKEVTQYLQQDLMCMQQTCKELAARQG